MNYSYELYYFVLFRIISLHKGYFHFGLKPPLSHIFVFEMPSIINVEDKAIIKQVIGNSSHVSNKFENNSRFSEQL
jgi:hypothetical protein